MLIAQDFFSSLLFFLVVNYVGSASVAPGPWFTRRDCESIVCPSDWEIGPLIGDTVGAVGSAASSFLDWMLPDVSDVLVDEPTTGTPTQSETDIEIQVLAPPIIKCNAVVPGGESQNGYENPRPCQKGIAHTIWPTDCANEVDNKGTADVLIKLDPKSLTSKHPDCPGNSGVYFWLAILTPEQVQFLKNSRMNTVDAIIPNMPYKREQIVSARPVAAGTRSTSKKKSRNPRKRDTVQVRTGRQISLGLSFLSTPETERCSNSDYNYLVPSGKGVRVYMIDGVDPTHSELQTLRIDWDWAFDEKMDMTDNGVEDREGKKRGYGTCVASVIAGYTVGVLPTLERLSIVKVGQTAASFLDGLGKIVRDIKESNKNGQPSKGRTVVSLLGAFDFSNNDGGSYYIARFGDLMHALLDVYQVVVVSPAGVDMEASTVSNINTWPSLLSSVYPILSVGSVMPSQDLRNGMRYPWSKGGPLVRLNAPGRSFCADLGNKIMNTEGGQISTAIVTGLAAYFLSLPDVGRKLRSQDHTPQALLQYMQLMSYAKYEGTESVWNGLNYRSPEPEYPFWYGTAPQSKGGEDLRNWKPQGDSNFGGNVPLLR